VFAVNVVVIAVVESEKRSWLGLPTKSRVFNVELSEICIAMVKRKFGFGNSRELLSDSWTM